MLFRLTTIAVVLIMGTASVSGKPLQSDAAAGFYQYDPTNEYAYAPASGSSSDSAEDTHNNGTVEDEAAYDDEYSGEQRVAKRSALPDDTTDKHGGDSELAADRSAPGTIALSDLVGAVEHTLVHSVQNLQQAVAIANNVSNATTGENNNSNPTSAVIALPIDFPAGETTSTTTPESAAAIGGGSSSTVLVTVVPEIDSVQSVKPNDPLSVLSIIALSTTTTPNTPQQATTEEGSSSSATQTPQPTTTTVTSVIQLGDAAANADNNITIIQTINSTQEVHSADSAVQRIQQQHITLFSAGAGVFPSIPSVALANQPRSGHNNGTADEDADESGSNESNSSEEEAGVRTTTHCDDGDGSDSSSDDSESDEKPDHHNKLVNKCALSTASKATTSTTTPAPNDEQIAAAAKEILKEKIAEVEAEPVILTQGI